MSDKIIDVESKPVVEEGKTEVVEESKKSWKEKFSKVCDVVGKGILLTICITVGGVTAGLILDDIRSDDLTDNDNL